jgi:predicted NBD/HSP70 family sugar kinase
MQQALACGVVEHSASQPVQLAELTRRAAAGDNRLAELFRRAGELLGLAIANSINMINPPLLVISGDGLRAGDMLRLPLMAAVEANVMPVLREATEIVFHPWGDEMWARGAAAIVLRQIYESPWNNAT